MRVALALGVALGAGSPAAASPYQLFGPGARAPALAGTGVASASGIDGLYLNPAGLTGLHGKHVRLGAVAGDFSLRASGDAIDRPTGDALGFDFGLGLLVPLGGALRDRVFFGASLYAPPDVVARIRVPAAGTPYFTLLESRTQLVGVLAGLALKFDRRWSAGASVLALGALRGTIELITDRAGRVAATTRADTVVSMAPHAGVRFQPNRRLEVGLVVRGPSRSSYEVDIENELGDELPISIPPILLGGAAHYDPLTIAAEAAVRPGERWRVTAQLAYERWSALPIPSLDPVESERPQTPPEFRDTVVPRAAVEWLAGDRLSVRAGYAFVPTPASALLEDRALIDNHRHVASGGVGLAFGGAVPVRLDLWIQHHRLVERRYPAVGDRPAFASSGSITAAGLGVEVELE